MPGYRITIYQMPVNRAGLKDSSRGVVGGYYYPSGDPGEQVHQEVVNPVGFIPWPPNGKRPIVPYLEKRFGLGRDAFGVSIVERPEGIDRVVQAVWISSIDVDGIEHTREFLLTPSTFEFGRVRVEVEAVV